MSSIPEDELEAIVSGIVDLLDNDGPSKKSEDEIKQAIRQYAAKERLDEHNWVREHSYANESDVTQQIIDKDEFDERIKQLEEGV